MFYFERMLCELLLLKKETNQTLLLWMKEKSAKNNYWKKRYQANVPAEEKARLKEENKRSDFMPFQTFLMSDLLEFAKSKQYITNKFSKNVQQIKDLRNWVVHNKDITAKKGSSYIENSKELESPLYKIEELKEFVKGVNGFFKAFEELESLIMT